MQVGLSGRTGSSSLCCPLIVLNVCHRCPGGESVADMEARVDAVVAKVCFHIRLDVVFSVLCRFANITNSTKKRRRTHETS